MFLRYHVLLLVFAKALFFEAKFSQVPETHEEILPLFTDAPLFSPTVGRCFAYVDKVRSVDVPCYKYRNILGNYLFSVDMQSHDGDSSQVNIPEWYMHIRARNKQAKHRASHKARKVCGCEHSFGHARSFAAYLRSYAKIILALVTLV